MATTGTASAREVAAALDRLEAIADQPLTGALLSTLAGAAEGADGQLRPALAELQRLLDRAGVQIEDLSAARRDLATVLEADRATLGDAVNLRRTASEAAGRADAAAKGRWADAAEQAHLDAHDRVPGARERVDRARGALSETADEIDGIRRPTRGEVARGTGKGLAKGVAKGAAFGAVHLAIEHFDPDRVHQQVERMERIGGWLEEGLHGVADGLRTAADALESRYDWYDIRRGGAYATAKSARAAAWAVDKAAGMVGDTVRDLIGIFRRYLEWLGSPDALAAVADALAELVGALHGEVAAMSEEGSLAAVGSWDAPAPSATYAALPASQSANLDQLPDYVADVALGIETVANAIVQFDRAVLDLTVTAVELVLDIRDMIRDVGMISSGILTLPGAVLAAYDLVSFCNDLHGLYKDVDGLMDSAAGAEQGGDLLGDAVDPWLAPAI